MKVTDYQFKIKQWPPSRELENSDTYLFGFDEDNQPYVLRYEHKKGYGKGWTATTLMDNEAGGHTAVPRHFESDTVGKIIKWWAEAPLLMRRLVRAERKETFERREKERKQRRDHWLYDNDYEKEEYYDR